MKPIILPLISLFAFVPLTASQQVMREGTETTIRALEREWTVGQSRNDNRALDLLFDNALVYVEYGKLMSKGEYLSRIRQYSPELDQIEMGPMNVHVFGSTAIVVGTYVEKQVQRSRKQVKRWQFIDTWVYKKNGWVLVAAGASPVVH
ncbi:MAG TPA: nuclear transport factor 2 family protein [Candidatus Sulfotelmatobacter sp.]|nr:nuclear transport factor 2 family protein [Candidatus Sulfotelmatobacter sp.]